MHHWCILIRTQVHARAFKLLTKLAGTVMDDEMLLYRLYLEYDASHSGALGLSELSKWVRVWVVGVWGRSVGRTYGSLMGLQ